MARLVQARSGFTDFQSVTFYNATFANPGDECGTLVATTVDVAGAVRFPRAGLLLGQLFLHGFFASNVAVYRIFQWIRLPAMRDYSTLFEFRS